MSEITDGTTPPTANNNVVYDGNTNAAGENSENAKEASLLTISEFDSLDLDHEFFGKNSIFDNHFNPLLVVDSADDKFEEASELSALNQKDSALHVHSLVQPRSTFDIPLQPGNSLFTGVSSRSSVIVNELTAAETVAPPQARTATKSPPKKTSPATKQPDSLGGAIIDGQTQQAERSDQGIPHIPMGVPGHMYLARAQAQDDYVNNVRKRMAKKIFTILQKKLINSTQEITLSRLAQMSTRLEDKLFRAAKGRFEYYKDTKTLGHRLFLLLRKPVHRRKPPPAHASNKPSQK